MRGTRSVVKRTLAGAAVLAVIGAGVTALRLRATVNRALAPVDADGKPLRFVAVDDAGRPLETWGGPGVEAVALTPAGLLVAGGSGVALVHGDARTDWRGGLPTLAVAALALWRGEPVIAPRAGGLYVRRDGAWQEARSGWGTLEVRVLAETGAGELLVGARQGLFRAAWGAPTLERVDARPVRAIALGRGHLLVGGEEGLLRFDAGRPVALPTEDAWIDAVALAGDEAYVVTPSGLLRGDPRGVAPLVRVGGGEDVAAGVALDGVFYGLDGGDARAVRRFGHGRVSDDLLPSPARRLMTTGGVLFADTDDGLLRREAGGWKRAAPRAAALPPGPAHVTALALLGGDLVAGLFDGGLVIGRHAPGVNPVAWPLGAHVPSGLRPQTPVGHQQERALDWRGVPGSEAWGVNALLPAGGALYVASLRGAARFDGRRLAPIEGPGAAFSLAATESGVAIGYGQGVLLPGARLLSGFHGLPGNQALALASGDALFVGTPSGLGAISDRRVRWRVAQGEGKLPHPWVTALALAQGGLYVGTYGGGIVRRAPTPIEGPVRQVDGARYQAFVETEGLKINTGCLVEAGGRLYAGTDGHGLYRLSRDGARFDHVALSLPSARVTALAAAPGALYVGTDEGIARVPLHAADSPRRDQEESE